MPSDAATVNTCFRIPIIGYEIMEERARFTVSVFICVKRKLLSHLILSLRSDLGERILPTGTESVCV
jgi:hypothetical protein